MGGWVSGVVYTTRVCVWLYGVCVCVCACLCVCLFVAGGGGGRRSNNMCTGHPISVTLVIPMKLGEPHVGGGERCKRSNCGVRSPCVYIPVCVCLYQSG